MVMFWSTSSTLKYAVSVAFYLIVIDFWFAPNSYSELVVVIGDWTQPGGLDLLIDKYIETVSVHTSLQFIGVMLYLLLIQCHQKQ